MPSLLFLVEYERPAESRFECNEQRLRCRRSGFVTSDLLSLILVCLLTLVAAACCSLVSFLLMSSDILVLRPERMNANGISHRYANHTHRQGMGRGATVALPPLVLIHPTYRPTPLSITRSQLRPAPGTNPAGGLVAPRSSRGKVAHLLLQVLHEVLHLGWVRLQLRRHFFGLL